MIMECVAAKEHRIPQDLVETKTEFRGQWILCLHQKQGWKHNSNIQIQINCNLSAGCVDWHLLPKMLAKQLYEVIMCGYCVYRLFTPPSDQNCVKPSLITMIFTPKLSWETHKKSAIECFPIASWWVCLSVVFLISSWTSWMRGKQGAVESGVESSDNSYFNARLSFKVYRQQNNVRAQKDAEWSCANVLYFNACRSIVPEKRKKLCFFTAVITEC